MKRIRTLTAFLCTLAFFAAKAENEPKVLQIDTKSSKIYWTGKKVTGEHTGTLMLRSGTIEMQDEAPVKVHVILDMTTIVVEDIKDPATNAKLLGHLKSDDFFSVAKFETGAFVAEKFTPIRDAEGREPNYKIEGDLTLKGITAPVVFEAYIATTGQVLMSSAELKINRTKWGIRYGSGSFFDNLGDRAIYDDIELVLVVNTLR
jgi:polyisoprenoid-binding protein YceI